MNTHNTTANIRRIRWTGNGTTRAYLVSAAIRLDEKNTASDCCDKPVPAERNWCDLTETGRAIVNTILAQDAVQTVSVTSFSLEVKIWPVFTWDDMHEWILELINTYLFLGEADIGELGKTSLENGVIRYKGTKKDSVRWYGVSLPLRPDEKCRTSIQITSWENIERLRTPIAATESTQPPRYQPALNYSVSAVGGDLRETPRQAPAADITADCLNILKEVYSLRGVMSIWVGAFEISVEIAPVFSWSDYHQVVVDIINKHLFDGKAAVEFDG